MTGQQQPASAQLPTAHREVLVADMTDQLDGVKDIHQALELLADLLDPVTNAEVFIQDLDRKQLGALLRIMNDAFAARLTAADTLLAQP